MTTMSSKVLVAAITTATLAMGATTAKADHYVRSCGGSYAPTYYTPAYATAPVVYAAPAYGYAPYRPVTYVRQPVYYPAPRYYAPAPVYRSYYAPSSFSFGFGYGRGGHGGHYGGGFSISGRHGGLGGYGGYRGHGGHFGFGGYRGHGGHSHHGGGFSFRVGR